MEPPNDLEGETSLRASEKHPSIPSVNFHLWQPCNMRCKFCFATFAETKKNQLPKGHLPQQQTLDLMKELAAMGFEKITFAGGEPTLCPWLKDLIQLAKEMRFTTMLVTNGSKLTPEFLELNKGYLDWITLSIDSLDASTNQKIGRKTGRESYHKEAYQRMVKTIHDFGYGLKINTVVSRFNFQENLTEFINHSRPSRWKVLQVLPIEGENDRYIQELKITDDEYGLFLDNHKNLHSGIVLVPETNDQMKGSYVMVDPAGRFFDNSDGKLRYSQPILDVGVQVALSEMRYDAEKFNNRGGIYNWKITTTHKA
jgi:radical S-adenosyl methionine domain-containing protein 2